MIDVLVQRLVARRPLLGVLLGLVGFAGGMLGLGTGLRDLARSRALVPEDVTLEQCSDRPGEVRLVRLTGGRRRCDLAVEMEPHDASRILGRVDQTLVPVEDSTGLTRVVLRFDSIECADVADSTLEGLLGPERDVPGWLPPAILARLKGPVPPILAVGGEKEGVFLVVVGSFMVALFTWFTLDHFVKWARMRSPLEQ